MNASTPAFRLGLFALTGAIVFGTISLQNHASQAATPASVRADLPAMITLPTISVRPSAEEIAAAYAPAAQPLPTLATVYVRPSEEEVLAARIDPTDRIQIMSTISVYPNAEELTASLQPVIGTASMNVDDESDNGFGAVFTQAVAEHHRLRLDMPYYSFGKVLTHVRKN